MWELIGTACAKFAFQVHMCVCVYVCVCVCMYVCVCVYMYVCVCMCVYMCVCARAIHIYIYACMAELIP